MASYSTVWARRYSPERRLHLNQPPFIVNLQTDAVSRQPQRQPSRQSRSKLPPYHRRTKKHRIRAMLLNRVRQNSGVLRHFVIRQSFVLRYPYRIRAKSGQPVSMLFHIFFANQHRFHACIQHTRKFARPSSSSSVIGRNSLRVFQPPPDCAHIPALAPRAALNSLISRIQVAALKHSLLAQIRHQLRDRLARSLVPHHNSLAIRLNRVDFAHPRRRPVRPERRHIIAQVSGCKRFHRLIRRRLPLRSARVYLRRDVFCHSDKRGQRAPHTSCPSSVTRSTTIAAQSPDASS